MDESKFPKVGQHVVFVDALSVPHDAIVTGGPEQQGWNAEWGAPWCNVVYVDPDPSRTDSYGRQVSRQTSLTHVTRQSAPGMYWCFAPEYAADRDARLRAETMRSS